MKNWKKGHLFLVGIVGFILIAALNEEPLSKDDDLPASIRAHLFVNDQLYWSSADPPDVISYDRFICIGEVETEVFDTPEKNFQAHGIEEGSKIYYNSRLPHIVYVERPSGGPYRYATDEACKDYLYHNGAVYASLSSLCSVDYEGYVNDYEPIYGGEITVDELPEDAVYLGDTRFVGYNMFVFDELESNAFPYPAPVYQDGSNTNLLYVGDLKMIYIPRIEHS